MKVHCKQVGVLIIVIIAIVFACKRLDFERFMAVSTESVSDIGLYTATVRGKVVDMGEGMNDYGAFYSTSPNAQNGTKVSIGKPRGTGDFVVQLSGLSLGTKYYVRIFGSNGSNYALGDEITLTTLDGKSVITTSPVTNITATTATCGGNLTYDGGSSITARGVVWSTSQNPTVESNTGITNEGAGLGSFTSNLSDLNANTSYYIRVYATNSVGTIYGAQLSFITQDGVIAINSNAITDITAKSAISGGNITSDGGAVITSRGVVWDTSPNPIIALITKTSDGSDKGSFSSRIIGLTVNTTYYVRAYAINVLGTVYSTEQSFKTLDGIALLTTNALTNISATSVISGGNIAIDGGDAIIARGVVWDINHSPTIDLTTKTLDGSGLGSFNSSITNLTANTTYYIRAYATNSVGTSYGNEILYKHELAIGMNYMGGIIFYLDETGTHGLVCATSDQGRGVEWGCMGTTIVTSTIVGTGLANTSAIVNNCNTTGIAARICNDLMLNGYSDWYLPSKDELNLMYNNLKKNGLGDFGYLDTYWSSSESNSNHAWWQNFYDGTQDAPTKYSCCIVRAIRAF